MPFNPRRYCSVMKRNTKITQILEVRQESEAVIVSDANVLRLEGVRFHVKRGAALHFGVNSMVVEAMEVRAHVMSRRVCEREGIVSAAGVVHLAYVCCGGPSDHSCRSDARSCGRSPSAWLGWCAYVPDHVWPEKTSLTSTCSRCGWPFSKASVFFVPCVFIRHFSNFRHISRNESRFEAAWG